MSSPLLAVTEDRLAIEPLCALLEAEARHSGDGCGALGVFAGVVRASHQGRRVRYLEYEAFGPLAVKTFRQIAGEAAGHWPGVRLLIHHRTGRLAIGDLSVVIVAAAAHRAEAFQACRYAIERVKQIAPVWKHEFFEDGDAWIAGAVADPADAAARRGALERACG
jgi:molybdopterin synthase catalytic subunit